MMIHDCTPAIADIVSGRIPRPASRSRGVSRCDWLVGATYAGADAAADIPPTPAWDRLCQELCLRRGELMWQWHDEDASIELEAWDDGLYSLRLSQFPHHHRVQLVLFRVNEDGTRLEIFETPGRRERVLDPDDPADSPVLNGLLGPFASRDV